MMAPGLQGGYRGCPAKRWGRYEAESIRRIIRYGARCFSSSGNEVYCTSTLGYLFGVLAHNSLAIRRGISTVCE